MNEYRPDPYELLKKISKDERNKSLGKLKIFFGYAAGVGKTYAMLEAAHVAKEMGIDVVAGYIEPHMRPDTNELINGLEVISPLEIKWNGITINEFNIDAAIKRHPSLILIDELAHTNAHGCRNLKRYQDIEELLKAGVDVYTTVNVQHIESLNDIVCRITKITVNERIPDKIIDTADKIEFVDIDPDELIERLNSGKVYQDAQAKRALENFFTVENLIALREIALRRAADQINKKIEEACIAARREYYTQEHILVCLSSSPSNAKVIRTAARMVNAFHGSFTALFVETHNTDELSDKNKAQLNANLKLAEQLGARIITVYGDTVPEQIAEYAKVTEASKIVLGRSNNKKGLFSKQSFVEKLTQIAPNLDIYIIPDNRKPYFVKKRGKSIQLPTITFLDSLKTIIILILSTILSLCFYKLSFNESNIIMIYILGVFVTSIYTYGKIYSFISTLLSVLVFNYFFIAPRFTLSVYDPGYTITFLTMFIVAFSTSTLMKRVKSQAHQNAIKSHTTEVLLETSQKLQKSTNTDDLYSVMGEQLLKLLDRTIIVYPVNKETTIAPPIFFSNNDTDSIINYSSPDERAVAEWVVKNNKNAGATTNTLSGAKCIYLAVRGQSFVYAIVAIALKNPLNAYEKNLVLSMLSEFGISLEKEYITQRKNEIHEKAKQEKLRANLLRAISHDLRTPLTSISGNASILIGNDSVLDATKKMQLFSDIYDDSMWLINLVENLLSLTRIDNAQMQLNMQAELIDEVIAEALKHINRRSCEYSIRTELPNELLMAKMDSRLIIQVIINIIDNAIKYTPPGTSIVIRASALTKDTILIEIMDNGNGISDEDKIRIFDMYFIATNNKGDSRRGLGLGLSLCKSVITAHGGEITVTDNVPKGTVFSFTLPSKETISYE